jgi:hypothetical protein
VSFVTFQVVGVLTAAMTYFIVLEYPGKIALVQNGIK